MRKIVIIVGIMAIFALAQAATIARGYGVISNGGGGGDGNTGQLQFWFGAQQTSFGKGFSGFGSATFTDLDTNTGTANAWIVMYSFIPSINPGSVIMTGPALLFNGVGLVNTQAQVIATDSPGGDTFSIATAAGYARGGNVISGNVEIF